MPPPRWRQEARLSSQTQFTDVVPIENQVPGEFAQPPSKNFARMAPSPLPLSQHTQAADITGKYPFKFVGCHKALQFFKHSPLLDLDRVWKDKNSVKQFDARNFF